jgi:phenylpyruvate tautomerase PptA (4-oxalocrotonate tautomerase family)
MPLLKIETSVALSGDEQKTLLAALSKIVAEVIGKPEQYVMVVYGQSAMRMSGHDGEAAFVDIRSIGGLSHAVNQRLAAPVCEILSDALGIPPDRIYLNFTEVAAGSWGWNGSTFA